MTYRYKLPPRKGRRTPAARRPKPERDPGEELTGRLRGKKASDLEEVFGRALNQSERILWWQYQNVYGAPARNMSGAKTLDFLVFTGVLHPVQIDDEWIHKSASTQANDRASDILINAKLSTRGARPVKRIKGNLLRVGRKANQEKANRLVEELF